MISFEYYLINYRKINILSGESIRDLVILIWLIGKSRYEFLKFAPNILLQPKKNDRFVALLASTNFSVKIITCVLPRKNNSKQNFIKTKILQNLALKVFELLIQLNQRPEAASTDLDINTEVPSLKEIEAAIKVLKNRKAPGIDEVTAEM
ncbi:hypothetical protein BpHYR1_026516 [Brachionus plicatilis]|uniref:Uncharacterized protein n=1 Tax=Brachionus plicatilis TaxID=10195 RepID=A0A3M7QUU1_BRAPC|nr:hypothetical protein BpHYR1_026516 [Brachionus plicatilis]